MVSNNNIIILCLYFFYLFATFVKLYYPILQKFQVSKGACQLVFVETRTIDVFDRIDVMI